MTLTGRFTSIVASVLALVVLVVAGCQTQRAEAPTVKAEPADRTPVTASRPEASSKESALQTSNLQPPTSQEPPYSVTTNEAISESAKTRTQTAKPDLSGPAVELALKFVPGRATTYKITTESEKSVEWKGVLSAKPTQFTDGRTGSHVELTFEQRVQQVPDDGSGVLAITIRGLKYAIVSVNRVVLDFDSARPQDSNSPLAALIGKGYQVRMSADGQILNVSDVEAARQAVQGNLPAHNVARRLLTDDEIRSRHEIVALSALKDRSVRPGGTWSSLKTFSFDDLGTKTYERVYTLKQVEQSGGGGAIVEMKAIPSAARAEELYPRQVANPLAKISDNIDSYTGRLVLDLDRGWVREYGEQMQNEWIIADPTSGQNPAAIRMAARRLHRLERVQE